MVLDIVIAILLFVAGALLYTFGILRVLLILFCGVPLTRKLKGLYNGKVASGAIYLKFAYTAALWLVLTAAATVIVVYWGGDYGLFGYLGGILLTLATTIGRLGVNERNSLSYLGAYARYIDKDLRRALVERVQGGKLDMKVYL